jgi:hypothetical protein
MRISSDIFTIQFWTFNVIVPLGLSFGMFPYLILTRPYDLAGGLCVSVIAGSVGLAFFFLGRPLSLRVFIYPEEGIIVAGKKKRSINGNEQVQVTHLPGLLYVEITFSDGESIKFFPQLHLYRSMCSSGAETVWKKLVNAKES